MRLADAPAFAAGLDMELPYCPLPLIQAVRLFWQCDPIRVPITAEDAETALDMPPSTRAATATISDTRH